jgi:phytoene dehydrogenase-like protein
MTKRFLSSLLLSAALLTPAIIKADDTHITIRRYYDRDHRDYHQWNRDEDQMYRQYLQENQRQYREFNRLNRNDRSRYWAWRHNHENADRQERPDNERRDRH